MINGSLGVLNTLVWEVWLYINKDRTRSSELQKVNFTIMHMAGILGYKNNLRFYGEKPVFSRASTNSVAKLLYLKWDPCD